MPNKALRYVITNARRTHFYAFKGERVKTSDVVTNPALAEHFPSRESANKTVEEGREGRWGTINEHALNAVIPISVEVTFNENAH